MNKIICFFIGCAFLLLTACSEKFNIAAPYKNITIIYGLLDMRDTAHYIRIEKAFLDQNKSAITMAQVPDSSIYNHINVCIKRFDFSYNYIDSIHLTRVDLNAEGYPKQKGVFYNAPNYAYKFTNLLDENYIYRIVVTNLISDSVDSAETPVINDMDPTKFTNNLLDNHNPLNNKLIFTSTLPNKSINISGTYNPTGSFSFNGNSSPIDIMDAIIQFNWTDSDAKTNTLTSQSYNYDLGTPSIFSNNSYTYTVSNYNLFNALAVGMGKPNKGTIYRLLGTVQLFVYTSTYDFNTYNEISLSQGSGLTGNAIEPTYTNIKGSNVLGLYTARGYRNGYLTIDKITVDSLISSSIINPTCNLVGTNYH